jgi:hypothetical protein
MTQKASQSQPSQFGACEYYSPVAEPHFKWFDSTEDERQFLHNQKFLDEQWQATDLWCCCSCIADIPVALPLGQELVKNLKKDDAILAGSLNTEGKNPTIDWAEISVNEAGELTDPADLDPGDAKAVLVNYGSGQNIMVSSYQLLLTSNGKLKQAQRLSLADKLFSKTGQPVPINSIKLGEFKGPRYHLGTTKDYDNTVDGHLLCLNEIVIADYVLQKHRNKLPQNAIEGVVE